MNWENRVYDGNDLRLFYRHGFNGLRLLIVCGYHYLKLVVVLGVESNIKPKTSLLVCAR